MRSKAYIGTSGWNYKSWRYGFYSDTPQKQWLRFCAERLTSIEVNGTLQTPAEKHVCKMAGRNAGGISFCHQRASLRHPQQEADRRRRTGDSLSRLGFAARSTTRSRGVAASGSF